MNEKERAKKVNYILEVMPNVSRIISLADDDDIQKLFEQARFSFKVQLNEASCSVF